MSCIVEAISRIGGIDACCSRIGTSLSGLVTAMFRMCVRFSRSQCDTTPSVSRIGGMQCSFGIVCTRKEARYLNVTPQRVFLFPSLFQDYVLVSSNTTWRTR